MNWRCLGSRAVLGCQTVHDHLSGKVAALGVTDVRGRDLKDHLVKVGFVDFTVLSKVSAFHLQNKTTEGKTRSTSVYEEIHCGTVPGHSQSRSRGRVGDMATKESSAMPVQKVEAGRAKLNVTLSHIVRFKASLSKRLSQKEVKWEKNVLDHNPGKVSAIQREPGGTSIDRSRPDGSDIL